MNSSGVGARLVHYAIIIALLLIFIKLTKKEYILKTDIKKVVNAFKVGIPLIIYILFFVFVICDFDNSIGYNSPLYIIGWILTYLVGAGFVEELVARGILIDILKKL